jgi:hypothetical protein
MEYEIIKMEPSRTFLDCLNHFKEHPRTFSVDPLYLYDCDQGEIDFYFEKDEPSSLIIYRIFIKKRITKNRNLL